ncbi:MAG: holo-ACP synthase [Planctomycetota bacterium]
MNMIKGIGIDLVEINRFKQVMQRQGKKFLERIFTPSEIKYCLKHKGEASYQHFAVRFAAKEAFLKAIGTGWGAKNSPYWTEIEVINKIPNPKSQIPNLRLSGKAKSICRKLKVTRFHLSLTHTRDYAAAIIILES